MHAEHEYHLKAISDEEGENIFGYVGRSVTRVNDPAIPK